MIALLFNPPIGESETAVGVGTVGSFWGNNVGWFRIQKQMENRRKAEGNPYDQPNIVTGVPLVAFSLKDRSTHNEFEVSDMLRRFGWIVPAYNMPPDAQHVTVLRVVIREDFSHAHWTICQRHPESYTWARSPAIQSLWQDFNFCWCW